MIKKLQALFSVKHSRPKLVVAVICLGVAVTATVAVLLNSQKTLAAWFDGAYGYRQRVAITNGSGSNLTDYQIKISLDTETLINAGKMQSDCDDIRITDQNGNVLPYWIETGGTGCDTATTNVWTKVTSIPTSGADVYLYYGNSQATIYQNGKEVFTFFDNFSGGLAAWTNPGDCAGTIVSGALVIPSSSTCDAIYVTNLNLSDAAGYAVDVRAKYTAGGSGRIQLSHRYVAADTEYALFWINGASTNYEEYVGGFGGATDVGDSALSADTFYTLTAKVVSDDNTWQVNSSTIGNTASVSDELKAETNFTIGLSEYDTEVTYDDVRVRKVVATEPTTGLNTEEVTPSPVAEWRFDEGQGTTARDSTTNNNDGDITGASWLTEDQCLRSHCLSFDGSSDTIDINSTPTLTTNFTASFWVKRIREDAWQTIYQSGDDANMWKISIDDSNRLDFTEAAIADNPSVELPRNVWTHVAVVKNGDGANNLTFYINGLPVGTASVGSVAAPSGTGYIGTVGGNSEYLGGMLDDFKLYGYARSANQIKVNYTADAAVLGRQNQTFISNGLVGYWKMDEDSGNAVDYSGLGNTLTNNSSVGRAAGQFDQASDFEISTPNDFSIADASQQGLDLTSQITIAAWVKPESFQGSTPFINGIIGKETATSGYVLRLGNTDINAGEPQFSISAGATDYAVRSNQVLPLDEWSYVVGVYDGEFLRIFINGQEKNNQRVGPLTIDTNADPLTVGSAGSSTQYFDGLIDEARVYNRGLSAAEVSQLYEFAPNPIGYWQFDDNNGQVAVDSSGNGHNGSLGADGSAAGDDPSWKPGKSGSALEFDTDEVVVVPHTNALNIGTSDFTVETWVKGSALQDAEVFLAKSVGGAANSGYGFLFGPFDSLLPTVYFSTDSGFAKIQGSTALTNNSWYHVAIAVDRDDDANTKVYLNGVEQTTSVTGLSSNTGAITNTENLVIGAESDPELFTDATLDEVKLYNYRRTTQQIVEDMAGSPPPSVSGNSLPTPSMWWKMDEQQGSYARNAVGGNGDLTMGTDPIGEDEDPVWKSKSDCKVNGCLTFNGSADEGYLVNNSVLDSLTNDMTVAFWVNPAETQKDYADILGNHGLTVNTGFTVEQNNTTANQYYFSWGSGSQNECTASVINLTHSTWQHVAFAKQGTTLKGYVNGQLRVTCTGDTAAVVANDDPFFVGRSAYNATDRHFAGSLDEVKIYNSALTLEQIKLDMNAAPAVSFGTTAQSQATQVSEGAGNPPNAVWQMDEKNGVLAGDSSGNVNAMTLVGATWTRGKNGSGLFFDGTDDSATIDNSGTVNFDLPYTIEFWMNSTSNELDVILCRKPSDWNFCISTNDTGGELRLTTGSGGYNLTSVDVTDGNWHHIALTITSGGDLQWFVDGIQRDLHSGVGTSSGAAIACVGVNVADENGCSTSNYYSGTLDGLVMYNYARSNAQIAYDYNRGAPRFWWRYDDCQGATAKDSSGNAAHADIFIEASGQISPGTCESTGTAWGDGKTGKFNASLNFDGEDDRVTATTPVSTEMTFSMWVKPDDATSRGIAGIADGFGSGIRDRDLFIDGDGKFVARIFDGGAPEAQSTTIAQAGQWYHLVMTTNATSGLSLYVNGRLEANTPAGTAYMSFGTASYTVGYDNHALDNVYFDGQADDVRIFSYVLSPDQVKQVYNGGAAIRFGP